MKRYLTLPFIILILTGSSLVVLSQDITLSQTNKSGIYVKGQKITVAAFAENLAGDTLHIKFFKNRTITINGKMNS